MINGITLVCIWKFIGSVLLIFIKVNKKHPSADLFPSDEVHEMEAYPPNIFPFSFLHKLIVGPLLLYLL